MAELVQFVATGRRKTAVARVILRPGEGKIVVNHQPFNDLFSLGSPACGSAVSVGAHGAGREV